MASTDEKDLADWRAENGKIDRHVVSELKKQKAICKSAFTKSKNRLVSATYSDEINRKEIRQLQIALDKAQDKIIDALEKLCTAYIELSDHENEQLIQGEMELIDTEYNAAHQKAFECLEISKSSSSLDQTHTSNDQHKIELGKDMWKQMKRVTIPVFDGSKKKYESWKASFMACIDSAPATPEYKMLQLRQYLTGEALQCIGSLGHSAMAYQAAKDRLERKFGGERRHVSLYLEELENFPPIQSENAKLVDQFADLLDIAIINLTDANRKEDLGNGVLYIHLQKKMPESMLKRYHRWIFETSSEENVLTLHEWIVQEAKFQVIAAETSLGISVPGNTSKTSGKRQSQTFYTDSKTQVSCALCKGEHKIWNCDNFKQLPVKNRWEEAKKLKLCYRCLGRNHCAVKCKKTRQCGVNNCQKTHNRLLHQDDIKSDVSKNIVEKRNDSNQILHTDPSTCTSYQTCHKYVALRTVPVIVRNGDKQLKINALLDDGSTKTYINEDVAAELGLQGTANDITVSVLNGKSDTFRSMTVQFSLHSLNGQVNMSVEANTTRNVTGKLQVIDWNEKARQFEHLKGIQFPYQQHRAKVDMLIGIDYAQLHFSLHEVYGEPGQPIARLTPLGWTCVGPIENTTENLNLCTFFTDNLGELSQLNNTLKRFWEIDSAGTYDSENTFSDIEKLVIKKTEQSLQYENGKYTIGIPWKKAPNLPDNYDYALKRLENTERKLLKNPSVLNVYKDTINHYVSKKYVQKVESVKGEQRWYLPHFPVVRPARTTTKVRLVFDASAKYSGTSLNDIIHQGPKLQKDIFDILMRFRRYPVALICDIQEMYLRIGIAEPDRKYHRFLWCSSSENLPEEYEFSSVVFGVNASPFLAQFVTQRHAQQNAELYPMAVESVLKSTYMDDTIDSVLSETDGVELYKQLSLLWSKAGMFARKWLSNSQTVLEQIPISERLHETDLSQGGLPSVKTLGILWHAEDDTFRFSICGPSPDMKITKRSYLKKISTLFDPVGFIVPYTVRAKMIMQDIWVSGVTWDEELPPTLVSHVQQWFNELQDLSSIEIPRYIGFTTSNKNFELHAFVDASSKAIGTVIFAKSTINNTVQVRQVTAKSKVSPLITVSIPRLELMAAVLGVRTTSRVCEALEHRISKVIFWSDSLNVLCWIRGQSRRYKPFVANRVGEIHAKTDPQQWRYIPTKENPADVISRGASVQEIASSSLWWNGPQFLLEPEENWPENKVEKVKSAESEMKTSESSITCNNSVFLEILKRGISYPQKPDKEWRLSPERFSKWLKFLRVFAWVYRFLTNCCNEKNQRLTGELNTCEIEDIESIAIRKAQSDTFREEIHSVSSGIQLSRKSRLVSLNPVLDEDGILRSDSRLKYAEFLSYNVRYPIILPRKHWITKLIIKHYHEKGFHVAGTNQTLADLSSKYWIVSGREAIREWENQCMECRRRKGKPGLQIMSPLPEIRLRKPLKAFAQVAVDFGGPYITIQGRGKRREKRYLCLFTCLNSRAVHLEMAFGLDTSSFMNAFYRMVNRRGLPIEVLSDNGTNFVGANRELRELVSALHEDQISNNVANHGIKWHFNPPLAPHFGGVHETMIKSAKRAIDAILGNADITDEELITTFTGAEALLNSRPLTYQSANPADIVPLTPNHFLHGQAGGVFAPDTVDTTSFSLRNRWRRLQELIRHFWKRWLKEWIPSLAPRKKWFYQHKDLKVDDVVLVISPDSPRGQWPLGRVTKIHCGKDGHIRAAEIRVKNSTVVRPITKLCPLELDSE